MALPQPAARQASGQRNASLSLFAHQADVIKGGSESGRFRFRIASKEGHEEKVWSIPPQQT
jgi:hypothetical protein